APCSACSSAAPTPPHHRFDSAKWCVHLRRGRGRRHAPRGRQVQFVLQDPSAALNPKHSVYEAVADGIRIHHLPGNTEERVRAALIQAELTPPERYLEAIPQELSGGHCHVSERWRPGRIGGGEDRNGVVEGPPLVRHERGMEVWM